MKVSCAQGRYHVHTEGTCIMCIGKVSFEGVVVVEMNVSGIDG